MKEKIKSKALYIDLLLNVEQKQRETDRERGRRLMSDIVTLRQREREGEDEQGTEEEVEN